MARYLNKIVIKNFSSGCALSGFKFFTFDDQVTFNNQTSNTTLLAEFTEAKIESNVVFSGSPAIGDFLTNETASYTISALTQEITITFNDGYRPTTVGGININISAGTADIEFYDLKEQVIFTKQIETANNGYYDLEGDRICGYRVFTTEPQLFRSKDGNNFVIDGHPTSMKVYYTQPANTHIKFALSFNGNKYEVFRNGAWQFLNDNDDPDDHYVNGMTIEELKALKQQDFDANPRRLYDTLDSSGSLITTPDVINISVMLKTNDELVTPTISRVVMCYI